jgi:hypothetical protein
MNQSKCKVSHSFKSLMTYTQHVDTWYIRILAKNRAPWSNQVNIFMGTNISITVIDTILKESACSVKLAFLCMNWNGKYKAMFIEKNHKFNSCYLNKKQSRINILLHMYNW